MECLGTILKLLCGWIKDEGISILLQLDDNIEGMRKEMESLRGTRDDLENDLRRAEMEPTGSNRLPESTIQVRVWLRRVDDLDGDVTSALLEFETRPRGAGACFPQYLWSGYDLSKRAKKLQEDAKELRNEKDRLGPLVSERTPEVAVKLHIPPTVGMASTLKQIFNYLGMDEVGVIGVHGGEGAGKTTLLKKVNNEFRIEPCGFDVVAFVEVSQRLDVGRIQDEISGRLGLKLPTAMGNDRPRMLYTALSRRRFLLLLDDVWEELDLRSIGIPHPDTGNKSKIVFATRMGQPLYSRGMYKRIDLRGLEDEEAWELVSKQLRPQVETAIRGCHGLPGAIETMASTWTEMISSSVQILQNNIKDTLAEKQLGPHQGPSIPESAPAKIRAVNLGGWLVADGLVESSLFDEIPNEDLLDGTKVHFKSLISGKYLCAEEGGGTRIIGDRSEASDLGTFRLWRLSETNFQFRAHNKLFVGVGNEGGVDVVVAVNENPGREETFEIVRSDYVEDRVRIKASNGFFLQVRNETLVTADSNGSGGWENNDPSIFKMTTFDHIQGEFQLTNGYGPSKAPSIMKDHWNTFIEEKDFKFISEKGLDAVKIPVGWWIACYPTPPPPFVKGSLAALDNAFRWAQKYGLKVIIELGAAPGSQNEYPLSGTRDGFIEWGTTLETIEQSLHVIEFLTARYAASPSLYGVHLLRDPQGSYIPFETLRKYYEAGYDAVRKHSSSAYVIACLNQYSARKRKFIPFANGRSRVVLNVHYYNMWDEKYQNKSPQQNIDYVHEHGVELDRLAKADGGRLIFVGEWVTEWEVQGATEDYQKLAKAQMEAYGCATFGWSYGNLRDERNHWSLEWMVNKGYITL